MHLEVDYTENMEDLESMEEVMETDENDSKIQMQQYLKYCSTFESQFERKWSSEKKDKFLKLYEALKEVAFVNSGCLSCDIDEEKMSGSIVYWSPYLFVAQECGEMTRSVMVEIFRNYPMISANAYNNGVQITIKERLYEEIKIADKQEELNEIRKWIKPLRN